MLHWCDNVVIVKDQVQPPLTTAEETWHQVAGFALAVLFGPVLFGLAVMPAALLAYISFVAMLVIGVDDSYPSWSAVIFGWAVVVSVPLSLGLSFAMARAFAISQLWILVGLYLGAACLLAAYTVTV
jgi:hypothetical protein